MIRGIIVKLSSGSRSLPNSPVDPNPCQQDPDPHPSSAVSNPDVWDRALNLQLVSKGKKFASHVIVAADLVPLKLRQRK